MRRFTLVLIVFLFVFLCGLHTAYADPRMETNKNFCHFILDPANTDNEVFAAGCDSDITVVEQVTASGIKEVECTENYRASGYAKVLKIVLPEAAPIPPGTTLVLTSEDSNTPCTMVESNGRAYTSNLWESSIKVTDLKRRGLVTVEYEIFCRDGK